MTRIRLFGVVCMAVAAVVWPQTALAAGPQEVPRVLVTEGFESTTSANYTTSAYTDPIGWQKGNLAGYWGRWAYRARSGSSSLWCDGTNTTAVTAHKYAEKSAGHAVFPLTITKDYYGVVASFHYWMPSLGYQENQVPAFVPQWAPTPNPGYYNTKPVTAITSSLGSSVEVTLTPSKSAGGLSLSRSAGEFRLQWLDWQEVDFGDIPLPHTGEGASVDDVTIAGWKYGPVRSLAATSTPISVTLTWGRPWRSTAETATEERAISYRVWRAPVGTSSWVELTSSAARLGDASVSYTDTTVSATTAYSYAVQAWDPGTGTETGEYRQIGASTPALVRPAVAITAPAPGATLVTTGAVVTGIAAAPPGLSLASVTVAIQAEHKTTHAKSWWNGTAWVGSAASITPTGLSAWQCAFTPKPADNVAYAYTITATATDQDAVSTTSAAVVIDIDSTGTDKPVITINAPAAGVVLGHITSLAISGTSAPAAGTSVQNVDVVVRRDDGKYFDGVTFSTSTASSARAIGTGTWSLSLPVGGTGTHSYAITAYATDNRKGNRVTVGASLPRKSIVDNAGPRLVRVTSAGATSVELRFSESVNRNSVALTDFRSSLRLSGNLRWSKDGRRVWIATTRQRLGRTYAVSLSPGAISDRFGNISGATTVIPLSR